MHTDDMLKYRGGHCLAASGWWDGLTDEERRGILDTYRRGNGGFGNDTDAMLSCYAAKQKRGRGANGK